MATNQALKNQLANKNSQAPQVGNTLKGLIGTDAVKKRFEQVLKDRAPQFLSSLLGVVNNNALLTKADPNSILQSAMIAASLDLPIDPNLGYAWIVPYSGQGSFQLGYKGYIQLALRTGQYKKINVIEVYDGELVRYNRLTEEFEFDMDGKQSEKIIGYAAYFELLNGFKKTIYWSAEEVEKHRIKFSKGGLGWKNDPVAMSKKTVLKSLLSKWGILSVEMQKAYTEDEKEERIDITEDVQEPQFEIIDAETTGGQAE